MPRPPTTAEKVRSLPWLTTYQSLNAVFCHLTVFGSSFILFLNQLGFDKTQIGTVMSFIPFCGLLAPFVAPLVARRGYKRSFVTFWWARNAFAAMLLLAPLLLARFGAQTTFALVATFILGFALCRAVGEISFYPWYQEVIPPAIRGKYLAISISLQTVLGFVAVATASYVLGRNPDLGRFLWLIGAGVAIGVISVGCATAVPGGAPVPGGGDRAHIRDILATLKDRNFRNYLLGVALVALALRPIESFIQLFMKEQIGLNPGQIVLLQNAGMIGGLLSCFLWGWAGDRFGSKPVLLASLAGAAVLPLGWLVMPRHSALSLYVAMGISFLWTFVALGHWIGTDRQLFVNVVPQAKKASYLALYYTWMGLFGGLGPFLAGRGLDLARGLKGSLLFVPIDPYTPLFASTILLLTCGILVLRRLKSHGDIPATEFAGMFLRGNPLRAMEAMVRHNLAGDELARIGTTARLGRTGSPLNVEELLETLADPSFNVRYEAIISIGRTRQDERLTEALVNVLNGDEPDLSLTAATALGRLGDVTACAALRETLASPYPLLRARSARALAALCDEQAVPPLRQLFLAESDPNVRIAYASALAALQSSDAVSEMLAFLRALEGQTARDELVFALARLAGEERHFMRLWRKARVDMGGACSHAILAFRKKFKRLSPEDRRWAELCDRCIEAMSEERLDAAAGLLAEIIAALGASRVPDRTQPAASAPVATILADCRTRLAEFAGRRPEYLLLALHTLNAALGRHRRR